MEFAEIQQLATLLSRTFASELLQLLITYHDISASEAASRLNLHIKTVQDFLDGLVGLGIAEKNEVYEKKRPYFRYHLLQTKIQLELDLQDLAFPEPSAAQLQQKIRERKDSGAMFTVGASKTLISIITYFTGEGRERREHKLSLTTAQGKFLYYLPFPTASPRPIVAILEQAGIAPERKAEVFDLLRFLETTGIVEFVQ